MSTDAPPRRMTAEEFLDLPERKHVERMLIRGEVWERKMTYRNPWHSAVLMRLAYLLQLWSESQSMIRGYIVGGDTGFRLSTEPTSIVGADAAFVRQDMPIFTQGRRSIFDGAPVLAVEVLSPSDRVSDVDTKVELYLKAGVSLVWVINTRWQTVMVYRPNSAPEVFNELMQLSGEPILPGLEISVADLFSRMPPQSP